MESYLYMEEYKINVDAETISQTGTEVILTGSKIILDLPFESEELFSHGWQSWSLTAWLKRGQQPAPSFPTSLHAMQIDPLYANEKKINGSWVGAIKTPDGRVLLLGALNLDSHVISEGRKLSGLYEHGSGGWLLVIGSELDVFNRYAILLGERLGKTRFRESPRIWCSWYSLYKEISENNLIKILGEMDDLPFDVFQIDDGWQKKIGDWIPNEKFSSGMQFMANTIKKTGRKAGLWLAPLLVVPSSRTFQNHPEWLLYNEKGKLVQAGVNWSEKLFALDTTHPEVLDWLSDLMLKVRNWGFDYVKLDFLYAGALPGVRYGNLPREAAYRQGLDRIRTALGDAYLLTCGAPILPSLGLCDAIRVGPDVSNHWNLNIESRIMNNFAVPGLQNAIRTSLNRIWLKPIVNTDPDVTYFHSNKNSLNRQQKNLMKNLAEITGYKATSDIPNWLTEIEKQELINFLISKPIIEYCGYYVYLINGLKIDFSEFIDLPKPLTRIEKVLQFIIRNLANLPVTLMIFDKYSSSKVRKNLNSYN